jgi:hypothetical protein
MSFGCRQSEESIYYAYAHRNVKEAMRSDDILAGGPSDLGKIDQLPSSDQARPVTADRAKRENGGLGVPT